MQHILLVSLVHNRKHLLSDCVMSAINQTMPKNKFIHLLFDNNSTDGATNLIDLFTKKHEHIRSIKMKENLGQQKAFNHILTEWIPQNMPTAKIWANLDSDDTIMPDALMEVNSMYTKHPEIGAAYSGFNIVDANSRLKVSNHPKAKMVKDQFTNEGQRILRNIFINNNPCGHIRTFNIECLKQIGGFDTSYLYATDYNIFGRIMTKFKVVKIDKVLYNFRQHGDQVEGKSSPQQTLDWQNLQKEFKTKWKEEGLL